MQFTNIYSHMDNYKLQELEQRIERLEIAQGFKHKISKENEDIEQDDQPSAIEIFFSWLFKDWLIKVGALLLVLALAWLVRYSFLEGWVGPVGRISFGYLFSVGIFFLGNQQLHIRRTPGILFLVIGYTGVLITTFAAREMYDFFTPAIALAIMTLATFTTVLVSHLNKLLQLAAFGLLGGAIAPLLAASSVPNYMFFACYAIVFTVCYLILTSKNNWYRLRAATCLVWAFMIGSTLHATSVQLSISLLLLFFAGMIFAVVYSSKNEKKSSLADLVTVNLLGIFTMLSVADLVKEHLIGLSLLAMSAGVILAADRLNKYFKPSTETFYGLVVSSITIFFAATLYQFDGIILNLVISFEILALIFVAKNLLKKDSWAEYLTILYVFPGLWVVDSFSGLYNSETIFNAYFVDIFGFILLIFAALALLKPTIKSKPFTDAVVPSLFAALIGYFYALIWVSNAVIFDLSSVSNAVSLVIYTVIGIVAYFSAIHFNSHYLKHAGIITLALVIIRLLFVEVWDMSLAARVITFLLIGLMMVGTSFYEKKYLNKK